MAIWFSMMAAGVVGTGSFFIADPSDEARNQCRAACAETWVAASACTPVKDAVAQVPVLTCRARADKAYAACLAPCGPAPAFTEAPAAKPKPKSHPKTRARPPTPPAAAAPKPPAS